jgi:cell division protein YceG involved in septum cleavage
MTNKVVIKITVDGQLYGGTYNFSKNLNYTTKQMIEKSLQSLTERLNKELSDKETKDERF